MNELDYLNKQVTSAIFNLEKTERRLSRIEERIARLTLPFSVEGRIARRGAVRAAVAGRDDERAKELVARFIGENGTDEELGAELKALLL